MPASVSKELADLARLAREGGLDLSPISLRVKADLLLSTPYPSPTDLAAFNDMAEALLPGVDEATALILARKLAGWPHTPAPVLAGLAAKGGAVLAELLRHGMPAPEAEIERLVETGDEALRAALAVRSDLTSHAVITLVSDGNLALDLALIANHSAPMPRAAVDLLIARARIEPAYRAGLLARPDLSNIELASLFLHAGAERRLAIVESLMAREALHPSDRRPALTGPAFAGWLDLAAEDRDAAFSAIAEHLGGGAPLAAAIAGDMSRDLAALTLTASGTTVEEATRFLIRLGADPARIRDFKVLAVKAAARVADGRPGYGMLLDEKHGREAMFEFARHPFAWLGRPVELPGSRPLRFETSQDIGSLLPEWPVEHCIKALCFYHPDDSEELKREQQEKLRGLFEAARKVGRELLIEIIASKNGPLGADTIARALEEIYALGIKPDWWKLEPQSSPAAWAAIEKTIAKHDPWCRGVLLLGLDAPAEELEAGFAATASSPIVKGFAVGRTIFMNAAEGWLAGKLDDEAAIADMAKRFEALTGLWLATRGRKAA